MCSLLTASASFFQCNTSYVLWTAFLYELAAYLFQLGGKQPVALLAATNRHGLVIFLAANLATGAARLTLPLEHMDETMSVALLAVYLSVLLLLAAGLGSRPAKLW